MLIEQQDQIIGPDVHNNQILQNVAPPPPRRRNRDRLRHPQIAVNPPKRSSTFKSFCHLFSVSIIKSPYSTIYERTFFHQRIGSRTHYGFIDHTDDLIITEGVGALWRGVPGLALESLFGAIPIESSANFSLIGSLVKYSLISGTSYLVNMLRIDKNNKQFNNSLIQVIKYAAKRQRLRFIVSGILLMGLSLAIKSLVIRSLERKLIRRKIFSEKYLIMMIASLLVFPLISIASKMQIDELSLKEAITAVKLRECLPMYTMITSAKTCIYLLWSYIFS